MAPVNDEAHNLGVYVDMHAFQFPCLVIAAVVAVKGQVAQAFAGNCGCILLVRCRRSAHKYLYLGGYLQAKHVVSWQCTSQCIGIMSFALCSGSVAHASPVSTMQHCSIQLLAGHV